MMQRALCVGINEFVHHPEATLRGCRNDALDMRGFLIAELDVPDDKIVYILDRRAEAQRILDALESLVDLTQDGDYLAFSFSSHGTQVVDLDGDELDGYHEALCCTDIKSDGDTWTQGVIMDKTLRELLKKVHPGARVECWIDTCYAGGIRQLAALGMTYSRARMLKHPHPEKLPKKRLLGLWPPDNTIIWAACKEAQTSADTLIGDKWCGAFTHFFRYAFRPELSREALLEIIKQDLAGNDYSQVPMITCGTDDLGGMVVGE
jgi:hypothetical protein